jgi:hypothetical protein
MKFRQGTSFSSAPPRYLVCRDRRPVATAPSYESAAEAAKAMAERHRGAAFTIYDIVTGLHVEAGPPGAGNDEG